MINEMEFEDFWAALPEHKKGECATEFCVQIVGSIDMSQMFYPDWDNDQEYCVLANDAYGIMIETDHLMEGDIFVCAHCGWWCDDQGGGNDDGIICDDCWKDYYEDEEDY